MGQKSRAELQAEIRTLKGVKMTEGLVSVANNVIQWAGIVAVSYFIYRGVEALAGQRTLADISVSFLGSWEISTVLAWTLATGGIIYGRKQRNLRRDTVQRLQGRIKELELNIDSRRSSSKLTERGETRPEDRV